MGNPGHGERPERDRERPVFGAPRSQADLDTVERLMRVALATARASGLPHHLAEDAAQNAITAVIRRFGFPELLDRPDVEPVLRQNVRWRAKDIWTRDYYRNLAQVLSEDRSPVVLDQYGGDLSPALEAALQSLTPRERACVALHHLEDRSLDDVAEITGSTTSAVKAALYRARLKLRRGLESSDER